MTVIVQKDDGKPNRIRDPFFAGMPGDAVLITGRQAAWRPASRVAGEATVFEGEPLSI